MSGNQILNRLIKDLVRNCEWSEAICLLKGMVISWYELQ